jgi:hypothetical protein
LLLAAAAGVMAVVVALGDCLLDFLVYLSDRPSQLPLVAAETDQRQRRQVLLAVLQYLGVLRRVGVVAALVTKLVGRQVVLVVAVAVPI